MSFHKKVVYTPRVEDYSFYFPDHIFVDKDTSFGLFDYPKRLLIGARSTVLNHIVHQAESVVYILGDPDYNLTDRLGLLTFVYDKWGKRPSKKLLESFESYIDDEFDLYCKLYWVSGRWYGDTDDRSFFFDILRGLQTSPFVAFQSLVEFLSDSTVEVSKFLRLRWVSFLAQVHDIDDVKVGASYSATYLRTLQKIRGIVNRYYVGAVKSYTESSIQNERLKTLKLFMDSFGI